MCFIKLTLMVGLLAAGYSGYDVIWVQNMSFRVSAA